jgi:hypothetical protein
MLVNRPTDFCIVHTLFAVGGALFFLMSQLPFPKTLATAAWLYQALLLLVVAFCLWRTWVLWPMNENRAKQLAAGAVLAPWWGYVLGGIAVLGIFALMAYCFHFQE